jgi:hypothetical protein
MDNTRWLWLLDTGRGDDNVGRLWWLDRPKDAFAVDVEHAGGAVVGVKAGEGLAAEAARNGVVVVYKEEVVLGVDSAPTNASGQRRHLHSTHYSSLAFVK